MPQHIGSAGCTYRKSRPYLAVAVNVGECQFQRAERQFDAKTKTELPAAHDSGEDIHDHRQVDELFAQANVCDVNGLLTNDKFCLIRTEKLQLRKTRSFHHSPVTTV